MIQENRARHEFFFAPPQSENAVHSWFEMHGRPGPSVIFAHPDLWFSRRMLVSMLLEAWDEKTFYEENDYLEPVPTESDRMSMLAWLQQLASTTGILSGEEIRRIQELEGKIPEDTFDLQEVELPTFEIVQELCNQWKLEGRSIGLFHGSFDPPTPAHLSFATETYHLCDRLLIGFDNDALLQQRKGVDRPRFPLQYRRQRFQSFWMVDATVVLRAESVTNNNQFVMDYHDLCLDYVFLATNQEDLDIRLAKIAAAEAKPIFLNYRGDQFSATSMIKLAQNWGFHK